jgi:hypothetical protein
MQTRLPNYRNYITPSNIMRGYNALTALLVLKSYFDDPNASLDEYFLDIAVHALQAATTSSSHAILKGTAALANTVRLASIYNHNKAGDSTIPAAANMIDVANHVSNLAGLAASSYTSVMDKPLLKENDEGVSLRKRQR